MCYNKRGYSTLGICKNGKHKLCTVHRLVAIAFIPNPENKPQVNHKDGDKSNCRKDNLEWNTCKENINHSVITGLKPLPKGSKNHQSKLSEKQVLEIRSIGKSKTAKDIGIMYNVSNNTIGYILNRKSWTHI